jgi:ferredoxin-type protein NapG
MMRDPTDNPIRRRDFFRRGLVELFKPIDKAMEPVARVARQFSQLDQGTPAPAEVPPPAPAPPPTEEDMVHLRPPGALEEERFLNTCSRSGKCVEVCPVHAIRLDPYALVMGGAPYIEVLSQPCIMCHGLPCTTNCPSGALQRVEPQSMHMGLAFWNATTCLLSTGGICSICVDRCPLGAMAIRLEDNRIVVLTAGCTGCGSCQFACPTNPRSIRVQSSHLGSLGA